jgi:1,4-alpha-glucan branching enzyme
VEYTGPKRVQDGVLFTLEAPFKARVVIVGDFNNWAPDKGAMTFEEEKNVWKKFYSLPPGKYEYKFFVNGKWIVDPNNPEESINEFGETQKCKTKKAYQRQLANFCILVQSTSF